MSRAVQKEKHIQMKHTHHDNFLPLVASDGAHLRWRIIQSEGQLVNRCPSCSHSFCVTLFVPICVPI